MSAHFRARLPWVLLTVTVVLMLVEVPLSLGQEALFDTVGFGLLGLTFAALGSLVAARHPGNPIGWIFCAEGVSTAVSENCEALSYSDLPMADLGAWMADWIWVVDLSVYAVVFLLFPTGRLPSRRWRIVVWALAAALLLGVPGQALNPDTPDNPFKVESVVVETMFGLGMVLLLSAFAAAVASVVLRYRVAVGVERLQLKQVVFAGSVAVPILVLAVPFYYESVVIQAAVALTLLGLPLAAGLAILRYRLYDIDVVINRALVYGALSATLAGTYLGSVLLLQLVLSSFTAGGGLAVAVSTLAVAALFQPARRRIQDRVDRRFFRSKYDAARTLARFGAHLRDEVAIETLGDELRAVVAETMQPTHVTLWLAPQASPVTPSGRLPLRTEGR